MPGKALKKTIAIAALMLPLLFHVPGGAGGPPVPFEREGRWGYADSKGRVIIEPQYITAGAFSRMGIAAVTDEKGWIYINRRGAALVRPFVFDNGPDYFSEGLARYTEKGRFGFFDERGRITIRAQFDFVLPFHEGLAAACRGCRFEREGEHTAVVNGKWGFIDRRGRWAIQPVYESAAEFKGGRALVTKDGRPRYLDRRGAPVAHDGQENSVQH